MKLSSPITLSRSRWILVPLFLLFLVPLLSACSSGEAASNGSISMAPMADMPAEVQQAAVTVSDAYRFAVANPDALQNVPCYCGCGAAGHTSNYSCYVKEVSESGEVVFDQHALGCSICVDIAQDVIKMTRDGKSLEEIRSAIDQTYSQYGPSNMPPVQ